MVETLPWARRRSGNGDALPVGALILCSTLSCARIAAAPPLVIALASSALPSTLVKMVLPALASLALPPTKSASALVSMT